MGFNKIYLLSLFFLFSCVDSAENNEVDANLSVEEQSAEAIPEEQVHAEGITVDVFDFENFKPFISKTDDKIHVINFWATWCKPCVAELPAFEELGAKHPEVEVTLVSLDFLNAIEKSLIPFILKNQLKSEVIVLHEPDGNKWIPEIDENWSGAIPATIIYTSDKKAFYEQSFTLEELEIELTKFK